MFNDNVLTAIFSFFFLQVHLRGVRIRVKGCRVCLFVLVLSSQSYGDVTIIGEGLQILTYFRQSWPLSSEDFLACNTYCDTGIRL